MKADSVSHVQSTLTALRDAFCGAASRHDSCLSRWVVAEEDYRDRLSGPPGHHWASENLTAGGSLMLREARFCVVSPEEREGVIARRPDATFECNSAGEQVYYRMPAIYSGLSYRGDGGAFREFELLARDAGYCLVLLLAPKQNSMKLRLPELVPYSSIAGFKSRAISTHMPDDLARRWIAFLHIVGWQNLPFSPIRAERKVWHENVAFLGDPEDLQSRFAETRGLPLAESLRAIPMPPRFFASTLLSDVNLSSVFAIDAILAGMLDFPRIDVEHYTAALSAINPGKRGASEFHRLAQEILSLIFDPDLHSPVAEERIHEGRGRIDIVFSNAAERGYFADLLFRHKVVSPVIFFECKNYSGPVGSAEFAQLAARFSDKRSNAGFIVCRNVADQGRIRKACRDRFQDHHQHVLVLDDSDLLAMLEHKARGDVAAISQHLHDKFRPIFMNSG